MLNLPIRSYALPNDTSLNRCFDNDQEYWTVTQYRLRLSRQGTWDYTPLPSSRSEEWVVEHSFATAEEAYAAYLNHQPEN